MLQKALSPQILAHHTSTSYSEAGHNTDIIFPLFFFVHIPPPPSFSSFPPSFCAFYSSLVTCVKNNEDESSSSKSSEGAPDKPKVEAPKKVHFIARTAEPTRHLPLIRAFSARSVWKMTPRNRWYGVIRAGAVFIAIASA
jgi:hypothetical protein